MHRPWHAHYPPGLPPRGSYPDHPLGGFLRQGAARQPGKIAVIVLRERLNAGGTRAS